MKNYLRTADCPLYRTHRALSTAPRPTLPYPNLAPAQVLLFENEKQAISSVPSRWFITVPSASPGQHPDLKITRANAPIVIINELCEFEWDPGCSDCLLNHQGSQGDVKSSREWTELTGKENMSITSIIQEIQRGDGRIYHTRAFLL